MKIYYINLKKSTERKKKLLLQLDRIRIPHKRIDAIYGKDMQTKDIHKLCYKPSGLLCSRSIIGCYASHIKAWKEFQKDIYEDYAIIMEDDCILSKNFEKNVKSLVSEINNLNPLWDFVYFGYYNLSLFNMFPSPSGNVHKDAKTYTIPSGLPLGFHCYLINKRSVEKLLEVMDKMYYHVDLQFYFLSKYFSVYSSKKKLAKQLITSEHSTQNVNFPRHMNRFLDNVFYTEDDSISPSYIMSSSLLKIPGIDCHVTVYTLVFLCLLKTFKRWKSVIYGYLLLEMLWCYDKEIMYSNLLLYYLT